MEQPTLLGVQGRQDCAFTNGLRPHPETSRLVRGQCVIRDLFPIFCQPDFLHGKNVEIQIGKIINVWEEARHICREDVDQRSRVCCFADSRVSAQPLSNDFVT